MKYMLDTNICSYIIKGLIPKEKLVNKNIILSSIVISELLYEAKKKNSKKLTLMMDTFINTFKVLNYDIYAAKEYTKIRTKLEQKGLVIGAYDMQIAAHAKSINAILVTNNEREFKQINNLKIENWVEK